MTEKNKWFDPKQKTSRLPVPTMMQDTSLVSPADCLRFLEQLEMLRAPEPVLKLFGSLATMPPHIRLSRNLKKVLDQLATTDGENFFRDGFSAEERQYLVSLQSRSVEIREIAERLLNVSERYQLFLSTQSAFRRAKSFPWSLNQNGPDLS